MNSQTFQVAVLSRLLHWGISFLILCSAFLFAAVVFYPGLSRGVDQKNRAVESKINETQAFMRGAQDMDALLGSLEKTAQFFKERTLKPGEHAKVISAVAEATRAQKITISSFKPVFSELKDKAKAENKPLLPVFFELEMECEYKQLGGFFETIEEMPLLLSVVRYNVKGLKPGRISADITLSAYEEWNAAV